MSSHLSVTWTRNRFLNRNHIMMRILVFIACMHVNVCLGMTAISHVRVD